MKRKIFLLFFAWIAASAYGKDTNGTNYNLLYIDTPAKVKQKVNKEKRVKVKTPGKETELQHHIGVNVGGGLHTLLYSSKDGKKSLGGGGMFQVQYRCLLGEHWGLGAGLGLSTLHSSAKYSYEGVGELATHPEDTDPENEKHKYYAEVSYEDLEESEDLMDMDMVLEGFYLLSCAKDWTFEAGVGISVNVPLSMRYKTRGGGYRVRGNFPYYNYTIEQMSSHGFKQDASGKEGNIEHKGLNMGVQVDLGMLHKLKERMELYMGLYLNYQFLSSVKASEAEMFNASTMEYNNSLNSYIVEDVHPFMVGAKVGLRFQVGK